MDALVNEFNCWFRNRVVGVEKKAKFDQLLMGAVKGQFKNGAQGGLFSFLSGRYVKVKKEDYLTVLKSTLVQYEREYQEITYVMLD